MYPLKTYTVLHALELFKHMLIDRGISETCILNVATTSSGVEKR